MVTRINQLKILVDYVSCDCKCKFNGTAYNCQCEYKKNWEKKKYQKNMVAIVANVFVRIVDI